MEEISNSWRLCDEYTVVQAALLFAGCSPDSNEGTQCEEWKPHERPYGYEGAKQSISSALRKGLISGTNVEITEFDWNSNPCGEIPNTTDLKFSFVERDSLVLWLRSKGVTTGFFFPNVSTDIPGYLDPNNKRFAPKLAAAVKAWEAMEDVNLLGNLKPKMAMERWLEVNYKALKLVQKQSSVKDGYSIGDMSKSAVKDVAAFANWETDGAPTKTPG
jgi:hypothetical protein